MKARLLLMTMVPMLILGFYSCGKEGNSEDAKKYTLIVKANNEVWGVATGSGTYNSGDRVDIEAVPASGYYFIKWSDGAVSNPRTVTVSNDMTFYALFSSSSNDPNPFNPGDLNEWVDLGLPSGLLWATRNVGANKPEDFGNYYAWGETTPKSVYDWNTYAYCHGSYDQLTKYCNDASLGFNGFTDTLTILESSDDAATVNWSNGTHTPTVENWEELLNNTRSEWTTVNGISGRKFTAINGNTLFLPAINHDPEHVYWSSSIYTNYASFARYFYFTSDTVYVFDGGFTRYNGGYVRAVRHR